MKPYTATLGLTLNSTFIPKSQSRNAQTDQDQLNYKITLTRENSSAYITTDYSIGIGHLPDFNHSDKSIDYAERIKRAVESARWYSNKKRMWVKVPEPSMDDVIYSLLMDANAIDYPTFELWAAEFGYNPDSIKARRIYRACLEIGLRMRAVFSEEELKLLREAYADY